MEKETAETFKDWWNKYKEGIHSGCSLELLKQVAEAAWNKSAITVDGAKMAFWISHSRAFPSYHFGTVSSLEIDIKGHRRVTCNEYGFALFKPIFIIPKAVGLIIAEKIKGIEAEYDAAIEEAKDKAKASISEINAWIKTFDEPTGEISAVPRDEA